MGAVRAEGALRLGGHHSAHPQPQGPQPRAGWHGGSRVTATPRPAQACPGFTQKVPRPGKPLRPGRAGDSWSHVFPPLKGGRQCPPPVPSAALPVPERGQQTGVSQVRGSSLLCASAHRQAAGHAGPAPAAAATGSDPARRPCLGSAPRGRQGPGPPPPQPTCTGAGHGPRLAPAHGLSSSRRRRLPFYRWENQGHGWAGTRLWGRFPQTLMTPCFKSSVPESCFLGPSGAFSSRPAETQTLRGGPP